jgi:hypothetical protein
MRWNPVTFRVMRTIFLIALALGVGAENSAWGSSPGSDSLDQVLERFFKESPPELFKYGGLAMYGEEKAVFGPERIGKENDLLELVQGSELMQHPTNNVWALCHDVLIHSPAKGQQFLTTLNEAVAGRDTLDQLFTELLFAGEFGEALAVGNLRSDDPEMVRTWSSYLSKNAIRTSSVPAIEEELTATKDTLVQQMLLSALMYISEPRSLDLVGRMMDTATNEGVQAKAIFVYTELAGYDGLAPLREVRTLGSRSEGERNEGVEWLKKETGPKNRFGTEVTSDIDFIMRFGDIRSPAMVWLEKEGLLDERKAKKGVQLSVEKKNELLDLLIRSKGFGLEAVKGSLFRSLEAGDVEKLLELRTACFYSPNDQTRGRVNTIGIMIRYLRKTTT